VLHLDHEGKKVADIEAGENERAEVDFNAADANEQPVQTTGTVKLIRRWWEKGDVKRPPGYREEEISTTKVATDAKGNASYVPDPVPTASGDQVMFKNNDTITHRIVMDDVPLEPHSKLKLDFEFFLLLRKRGQRAAQRFLDTHFNDIGKRSTIDLMRVPSPPAA